MAASKLKQLAVAAIPRTMWGINARSELDPGVWDCVRQAAFAGAWDHCEACRADEPLHGHEVWDFQVGTCTMKLVQVRALCVACHEAAHLMRCRDQFSFDDALKQLAKVNRCTKDEALAAATMDLQVLYARFDLCENWTLNLSLVDGIKEEVEALLASLEDWR